jgi:glycosyltransferase involved in cell wall biosynthesis
VSGRISEEKGQDVLVRAFKNVIEKNNLFRLNILGAIGNLKYYDKLKEIIHDLNLSEYIKFLGFKTNPYPYYKYADLLVLPSRWEGLPNVVLEALYLQTPVIVTNCIPYFQKLLKKDSNGYIVDVDDSDGMAEAIINYRNLKVDKGTVPKVNMERIFKRMISHE